MSIFDRIALDDALGNLPDPYRLPRVVDEAPEPAKSRKRRIRKPFVSDMTKALARAVDQEGGVA